MKATIISFRRGRHTQRTNQFLLEVEGIDSAEKATKLIGTKVSWTSPGKKEIKGTITALHGRNGVVRARFTKGLPGEAVRTPVTLLSSA